MYKVPKRKPWDKRDNDIITRWFKIQVDPTTLLVDTSDYTFSSSVGQCHHWKEFSKAVPFGTCFDCESPHSDGGRANIDLRGTPFAVEDGFHFNGCMAAGSWDFKEDNQVVFLKGGGYCGWTAPNKANDEYKAHKGGYYIQLKYIGEKKEKD